MVSYECQGYLKQIELNLKNGENINTPGHYLLNDMYSVLELIKADDKEISQYSSCFKETILLHICFKFYQKDMIEQLTRKIENFETQDPLDKIIASIISEEPFVLINNLKGQLPEWFYFILLSFMVDINALPMESYPETDDKNFWEFEYNRFLNYLLILDPEFEVFVKYTYLINDDVTLENYLYHIITHNVEKYFHNIEDKLQLNESLDNILVYVSQFKSGERYIQQLARVSFIIKNFKFSILYFNLIRVFTYRLHFVGSSIWDVMTLL
jgi:hypothetical protein